MGRAAQGVPQRLNGTTSWNLSGSVEMERHRGPIPLMLHPVPVNGRYDLTPPLPPTAADPGREGSFLPPILAIPARDMPWAGGKPS